MKNPLKEARGAWAPLLVLGVFLSAGYTVFVLLSRSQALQGLVQAGAFLLLPLVLLAMLTLWMSRSLDSQVSLLLDSLQEGVSRNRTAGSRPKRPPRRRRGPGSRNRVQ